MATIEMIGLPADGTANPGGHFHAAELDNMARAINGAGVNNHTYSLTVTGVDMIVTVPAVTAWIPDGSGTLVSVTYAGGNATITASDATNPRTDIITLDSGGTLAVTAGVATEETGTVEEAPEGALASDEIMLVKVRVEANVTVIATTKVVGRAIDVSDQKAEATATSLVQAIRTEYVDADRAVLCYFRGGAGYDYESTNQLLGAAGIGCSFTTTGSSGSPGAASKGRLNFAVGGIVGPSGYAALGPATIAGPLAIVSPDRSPEMIYRGTFQRTDTHLAHWYIGFAADFSVSNSSGAVIRRTTTGAVNFVTRQGGAETATSLGALDDTALRSASIYTRDAGVTWVCEVDGAVVATHTTNVPTVSTELIPLVIIKAGGGYMAAPTGSPEFWYVEADLVALG